jgi:hypothetical protein
VFRRIAGIGAWVIGPLLGVSAGFYFTLFPFGGSQSMLPLDPVSLAAASAYYVGGGPTLSEATQAWVWLCAFATAFLLWGSGLSIGGRLNPRRLSRLWLAYTPSILVGVPLAYLSGLGADGFRFETLINVALRKEFQAAPEWAAWVYPVASAWATLSQLLWLWRKIRALMVACVLLLLLVGVTTALALLAS